MTDGKITKTTTTSVYLSNEEVRAVLAKHVGVPEGTEPRLLEYSGGTFYGGIEVIWVEKVEEDRS